NRGPQPLFSQSAFSAAPPTYLHKGDTATLEGRWEITFRLASASAGTDQARPAPGSYYLLLGMTVCNATHAPQGLDEISFRLWDAAGQEHPLIVIPAAVLPIGMLQPGEQKRLVLPYEVPGFLHVFKLVLESRLSGASRATWEVVV